MEKILKKVMQKYKNGVLFFPLLLQCGGWLSLDPNNLECREI